MDKVSMGHFYFKFILSSLRIHKTIKKRNRGERDGKEKTMVIDDNIIYLSRVGRLRIAKCIKPSRRKTLKQQQRHLQLQLRRRLLILKQAT